MSSYSRSNFVLIKVVFFISKCTLLRYDGGTDGIPAGALSPFTSGSYGRYKYPVPMSSIRYEKTFHESINWSTKILIPTFLLINESLQSSTRFLTYIARRFLCKRD